MNKIFIIVGAVVLVAGGVFGGMMLGKKQAREPGAPPESGVEDEIVADAHGGDTGGHGKTEDAHGEAPDPGEGGSSFSKTSLTYSFDTITTNLADLKTLVRTTIQLEAYNMEGRKLIEENIPPLRDATIMVLSSKDRGDIMTYAGKERLKRELKARYEGVINAPKVIRDIYFDGFLVQ